MLNSSSVLRNDVTSYALAHWVWDLFGVEFVFFFIVLGPGLTGIFLLENHPKIALNQWYYFGVVYHVYSVCIYALLKVVGYYDLSVLSMSVMGFQKKKFGWRVGGWGELHPILLLTFLNFAKPLKPLHCSDWKTRPTITVFDHHNMLAWKTRIWFWNA